MKKFLALLMTLAMCLSLAACGGNDSTPPADNNPPASTDGGSTGGDAPQFEKMTWKYTCSATENTCWADMGRDFGQMVSDATGGAVTVEVYDAGKAVGEVVESMGLHLLGIAENGFRHPTNSVRPITSVADMKGLKLRVAGSKLLNREYELWGANYTNANWSEVYTGLQTGTYDGQENPLPTANGASIQEVQKYVTYWTGVYDCIFFTMNGDLYNSLSPELQKIVDECGLKAAQNQRVLERQGDQEVLEAWKAAGVTVTELTPEAAEEFRKTAESIYTEQEFVDMIGQDLIDAFTK